MNQPPGESDTDVTQRSNESDAQSDPARVLVTGANGQIGRRLIERLARSSPRVPVCAVVRSKRAAEALEALPVKIRPGTASTLTRTGIPSASRPT